MSKDSLIAVAKVVGVHGVKGEIKVLPYIAGEDAREFAESVESLWTFICLNGNTYNIDGIRSHKGVLLVELEGVTDREGAEALAGEEVFVERERLPVLPEGEFYQFELVGMDVVSEDGEELGKVTDILSAGGNNVYEVHGPRGEILIPVIEDVVIKVDAEGKRITVKLLEGLLPDVTPDDEAPGDEAHGSGEE